MKISIVLSIFLIMAANANSSLKIPLNKVYCTGQSYKMFFGNLTFRGDLNSFVSNLGQHSNTHYKFDLLSDVYTGPAIYNNGGYTDSFIFLSNGKEGLTISRFALLVDMDRVKRFNLLAQHPVKVDLSRRLIVQSNSLYPSLPPEWSCRY